MHSAIWGIRDVLTIRMRQDRLNWRITSQDGDLGIFANAFPFVNPRRQETYLRPIIILSPKNIKNKIIYILFVEKFAELAEKNNKEFKKRKKWIKSLGKLNINLFGNKDWPIEKMKYILKQYDTKHKEHSREYFGDKARGQQIRIDFNMNIDDSLLRMPSKIAFNYFAYCAIKQNMGDILLKSEFDKVRNYIRFGPISGTQRPISIINKPILYDEKNSNKKIIGHILTFYKKDDNIISEITFFNLFTYRVVLGRYPFKLYGSPNVIIGKPDYGLFCR